MSAGGTPKWEVGKLKNEMWDGSRFIGFSSCWDRFWYYFFIQPPGILPQGINSVNTNFSILYSIHRFPRSRNSILSIIFTHWLSLLIWPLWRLVISQIPKLLTDSSLVILKTFMWNTTLKKLLIFTFNFIQSGKASKFFELKKMLVCQQE